MFSQGERLSAFQVYALSRSYAVGIVTRLRAGRSGVRIAVGAGDLSPFQNVQTDSEAQPDSCSVGPGLFPRGVHLTTDLCLVPRVRMSGTLRLLSLYVFISWTGTALMSVR